MPSYYTPYGTVIISWVSWCCGAVSCSYSGHECGDTNLRSHGTLSYIRNAPRTSLFSSLAIKVPVVRNALKWGFVRVSVTKGVLSTYDSFF